MLKEKKEGVCENCPLKRILGVSEEAGGEGRTQGLEMNVPW